MNIPEHSERLSWVHASDDLGELAKRYDNWAEEYDRDSAKSGSKMIPIGAALTCRYVQPKDGLILDAGAGTGKLGELLWPLGYKDIVGIDISEGMLKAAQKKGVYKEVRQMAIGERMDFPDDHFASFNVTTVLRTVHMPTSSLDELIRITRPGGYGIFSIEEEVNTTTDAYGRMVDAFATSAFRQKMDELEKQGAWRQVEVTDFFQAMPYLDPNITRRFFVYKIR